MLQWIKVIADVTVTEKSFGPKSLMTGVKFSVDDGEKVGVIGRNGVGKSTLFGILAGTDTDYTGEVIYRRVQQWWQQRRSTTGSLTKRCCSMYWQACRNIAT